MPLGIKDIIETIDMPTENGSPLFAGWRSERDGASVAALREAGADLGLDSTGDPNCTVHSSLLGIPAISIPLLHDESLPLGLQVTGFINGDAQTFAAAAAINALF
jgi:Asp-tRNA(Asn)/Glu-tRNA(Gln) amidotransferase A subunit family amidase